MQQLYLVDFCFRAMFKDDCCLMNWQGIFFTGISHSHSMTMAAPLTMPSLNCLFTILIVPLLAFTGYKYSDYAISCDILADINRTI